MAKDEGHVDVDIQIEGTIILFHLVTDEAKQWVRNHVASPLYFGDALVVGQGFYHTIIEAMEDAGLYFGHIHGLEG